MRLRYIVLFRHFRLGYQFYVVILRDISTHHALKYNFYPAENVYF